MLHAEVQPEVQAGIDAFLESPYNNDDPFGTDEERKKRNKEASIDACRNIFLWRMTKAGGAEKTSFTCKYHRECDPCRLDKYEQEVEKRLNYARLHMELGDQPRYIWVDRKNKETLLKRLFRRNFDHYSFPQPDDTILLIHNDPDGEGDELWDFGYDEYDPKNEGNGFDLNFYTILKNIPEGNKISGNLGKEPVEVEKEENDLGKQPAEEKESMKIPMIYKEGLTERDLNLALNKAILKTQNIKVETVLDLEQALFARANAINEQLKNTCSIFFTWDAGSQEDVLLWNTDTNNFSNTKSDNVHFTTIDSYSSKMDKTAIPPKKITHFDAVIERGTKENPGFISDDEAEKNIQDFLNYHGR